jgi:starvation-inducible outer membrane lipoprotein
LTLLLPLAFAASLSGCATIPQPVTINIPPTFREPCPRADLTALGTVGDLGGLIVRQEAAVAVCDARRAGVVALVDAHAATVKPRKWWQWR